LGIVLGNDTLTLRGGNLIAPRIDLNGPSARANSFLLSPVGIDDTHTLVGLLTPRGERVHPYPDGNTLSRSNTSTSRVYTFACMHSWLTRVAQKPPVGMTPHEDCGHSCNRGDPSWERGSHESSIATRARALAGSLVLSDVPTSRVARVVTHNP